VTSRITKASENNLECNRYFQRLFPCRMPHTRFIPLRDSSSRTFGALGISVARGGTNYVFCTRVGDCLPFWYRLECDVVPHTKYPIRCFAIERRQSPSRTSMDDFPPELNSQFLNQVPNLLFPSDQLLQSPSLCAHTVMMPPVVCGQAIQNVNIPR